MSPTAASIGGKMADSCRLLHARHCEIPVYAGMVHGETGIHRRIRQLSTAKLPPPPNPQNPPTHSRPPQDHSCESRNLIAKIHTHSRSPTRPFLRRQESHNHMPPTAATIGAEWRILADCCMHDTVRFLPTQEWSRGESPFYLKAINIIDSCRRLFAVRVGIGGQYPFIHLIANFCI